MRTHISPKSVSPKAVPKVMKHAKREKSNELRRQSKNTAVSTYYTTCARLPSALPSAGVSAFLYTAELDEFLNKKSRSPNGASEALKIDFSELNVKLLVGLLYDLHEKSDIKHFSAVAHALYEESKQTDGFDVIVREGGADFCRALAWGFASEETSREICIIGMDLLDRVGGPGLQAGWPMKSLAAALHKAASSWLIEACVIDQFALTVARFGHCAVSVEQCEELHVETIGLLESGFRMHQTDAEVCCSVSSAFTVLAWNNEHNLNWFAENKRVLMWLAESLRIHVHDKVVCHRLIYAIKTIAQHPASAKTLTDPSLNLREALIAALQNTLDDDKCNDMRQVVVEATMLLWSLCDLADWGYVGRVGRVRHFMAGENEKKESQKMDLS